MPSLSFQPILDYRAQTFRTAAGRRIATKEEADRVRQRARLRLLLADQGGDAAQPVGRGRGRPARARRARRPRPRHLGLEG